MSGKRYTSVPSYSHKQTYTQILYLFVPSIIAPSYVFISFFLSSVSPTLIFLLFSSLHPIYDTKITFPSFQLFSQSLFSTLQNDAFNAPSSSFTSSMGPPIGTPAFFSASSLTKFERKKKVNGTFLIFTHTYKHAWVPFFFNFFCRF